MKDYLLQKFEDMVKAAPVETQVIINEVLSNKTNTRALAVRHQRAKAHGQIEKAFYIKAAMNLLKTHAWIMELEQ
ncbi:hypothetical protein BZJ19_11565 [Salinivibrio proteolyticus]|uniref:hypothetical protein n=1 Tax=Salinivibrio proteolyticus TaxID=334715 RepID=UPI0009893326|nr:hypothetical protein [Salinivibrio proteolyticus]OOF24009.1 hypothetical protein BZJ19_11565 [Salinivibrio proteolyticus]